MHLATPRDVLHTQRQILWKGARKGLTRTDLLVFQLLVLHADREGRTFVRIATLAREGKMGERTVRRSLAALRREARLEVVVERTGRGRSNLYRLRHVAAADVSNDTTSSAHEPAPMTAESAYEQPSSPATYAREQLLAEPPVVLVEGEPVPAVESFPEASEPSFSVGSGGQIGLTHTANLASPPPSVPYCDRTQIDVTPCIPPRSGGTPEASPRSLGSKPERATRAGGSRAPRPSLDTVERVLGFFLAQLWPHAKTTAVTRKRRRLVAARLGELAPESAEETLMDAVRGAKLHSWHRTANTGFYAEKVFRDADTVEQLAGLGRSKRLQDARRAQGQGSPPLAALGRSKPVVTAVRAGIDIAQMQADLAGLFGSGFAAKVGS